MTREELRTEVLNNLLEVEKVKKERGATLTTRINTWLDWAQYYIANKHTYEEMRKNYTGVTVADQKRYGFPANMKDIFAMTLQDGASSRKLTYVNAREFDLKIPRSEVSSTGRSSWYVDYGVNFELYRIPNDIYTLNLRCSVYPTAFASDSTESDLLRKDELICAIATGFGFYAIGEADIAKHWFEVMIPLLYDASLESDHSAVDWTPVARGFTTRPTITGEWWKSLFVGRQVPGF